MKNKLTSGVETDIIRTDKNRRGRFSYKGGYPPFMLACKHKSLVCRVLKKEGGIYE